MRIITLLGFLSIICCSCVVDILNELPFCTAETRFEYWVYQTDSVLIPGFLENPRDEIAICAGPQHGDIRFRGIGQIFYLPEMSEGMDSLTVKLIQFSGMDTMISESKHVIEIFESPESRCLSNLFELPDTLVDHLPISGIINPQKIIFPVLGHCSGFIRTIHILQSPSLGSVHIQYEPNGNHVLIYANDQSAVGEIDELIYKVCVKVDGEISCRNFVLQIEIIN